MRVPESLPSTAVGSALLLYLERVGAVFAILLFLLVFLYRSLVHGELPTAISGRGAEWSDLSVSSKELQTQVDELDAAVERLRESVERQG
jgi:peptidoglycan hydrolase CwlO-like protein